MAGMTFMPEARKMAERHGLKTETTPSKRKALEENSNAAAFLKGLDGCDLTHQQIEAGCEELELYVDMTQTLGAPWDDETAAAMVTAGIKDKDSQRRIHSKFFHRD